MTNDPIQDLEILIRSRVTLIEIATQEETRAGELFCSLGVRVNRPVFGWSVTRGLHRLDLPNQEQGQTLEPADALQTIKSHNEAAIYLLFDFHPYLEDAKHIRLLKEIALNAERVNHTVALISHSMTIPPELKTFTAAFALSLPNSEQIEAIVRAEAVTWAKEQGSNVKTTQAALQALVRNLVGLTGADVRRLARGAIRDDGAITESDLPNVMRARYQLVERGNGISFEYDTVPMNQVAGLAKLKRWLETRRQTFVDGTRLTDTPKGILLLGVQGAGKSLAAKAVAASWSIPLLRLDMGSLFNKFFGETERNLRDALATANAMAPCVLWVDEIEKAIADDSNDNGTSRRLLGHLLTWMAERSTRVFIVATANDISRLPPELIRKGRVDEIFFVDLPAPAAREEIFRIHLAKREIDPQGFDLSSLAASSHDFSGAEIEQAIVSALYLAREGNRSLSTHDIQTELAATKPLSVTMGEDIANLREWARERCVLAD